MKNVCPPCLYKVESEPPLKFSHLAAMDGNNSLKLVDSAFRAGSVCTNTCSSASQCWISPGEVDTFKDEVKKVSFHLQWLSLIEHDNSCNPPKSPFNNPLYLPTKALPPNWQLWCHLSILILTLMDCGHEDLSSEEIAWLNVTEHDELAKCLNTCVDRWKNAGPEARIKMFALFAISRIFLAVCCWKRDGLKRWKRWVTRLNLKKYVCLQDSKNLHNTHTTPKLD